MSSSRAQGPKCPQRGGGAPKGGIGVPPEKNRGPYQKVRCARKGAAPAVVSLRHRKASKLDRDQALVVRTAPVAIRTRASPRQARQATSQQVSGGRGRMSFHSGWSAASAPALESASPCSSQAKQSAFAGDGNFEPAHEPGVGTKRTAEGQQHLQLGAPPGRGRAAGPPLPGGCGWWPTGC